MVNQTDTAELVAYLKRVPGAHPSMSSGILEGGNWWVKFQIDIAHPVALEDIGALENMMQAWLQ